LLSSSVIPEGNLLLATQAQPWVPHPFAPLAKGWARTNASPFFVAIPKGNSLLVFVFLSVIPEGNLLLPQSSIDSQTNPNHVAKNYHQRAHNEENNRWPMRIGWQGNP
jgi:hypothetical protein